MNPLPDTSIQIPPADPVSSLKGKVRGQLVFPGDQDYEAMRQVWNVMIDRRPSVIVRCADADDVAQAVGHARANGLKLSIRGGGHNIAGSAVRENAMLIDLADMKNISVDARIARAYVEPGATLADFDRVVQAYGLATPVGINSTTGIAGLTLGGGFGWLTRQYGMTIDNLVSVDMVMADGSRIHAAENENADLFWAVRGGGGNFGAVTRFEFKLHPVGPEITAGLIVFPMEQAGTVLHRYRELVESAPEEFSAWVILRQAPPLPFLPELVHGKHVIVLAVFHNGESTTGDKLIEALRGFGSAYGEHIGTLPYVQWQQAFDPLLTPGARNYWKSHNFKVLSDGAVDTMIEFAGRLPSPQCEIFVGLVAGAANRVAPDATAYAHRDARFVINVHGRWEDAATDEAGIAWARAFFDASAPFASAGAYVNFMTADEGERVAAAYGANYARLSQIKRKYDPTGLFSGSINIRPE